MNNPEGAETRTGGPSWSPCSTPTRCGSRRLGPRRRHWRNKTEDALNQARLVVRSGHAQGSERLARLLIVRNLRLPLAERQWDRVDQTLNDLERVTPDSPAPALFTSKPSPRRPSARHADLLKEPRKTSQPVGRLWTVLATSPYGGGQARSTGRPDEAERLGHASEDAAGPAGSVVDQAGRDAPAGVEHLQQGAGSFRGGAVPAPAGAGARVREGQRPRRPTASGHVSPRRTLDLNTLAVQFEGLSGLNGRGANPRQIRGLEGDDGVFWRSGNTAHAEKRLVRATAGRYRRPASCSKTSPPNATGPAYVALAELEVLDGDAGGRRDYLRAIVEASASVAQAVREAVQLLLYDRKRITQAALVFQKLRDDRTPISGDLLQLDADVAMGTRDAGAPLNWPRRPPRRSRSAELSLAQPGPGGGGPVPPSRSSNAPWPWPATTRGSGWPWSAISSIQRFPREGRVGDPRGRIPTPQRPGRALAQVREWIGAAALKNRRVAPETCRRVVPGGLRRPAPTTRPT